MGDVFPTNNSYPDFLIEEVETERHVAIECKWRKFLNHSAMMDLFSPEQLTTYQKFSQERDLPVFIILGIGGEPCEPEDIYIIPLEKATFVMTPSQTTPNALVYEHSQLKPFKRMDINAPLCFDEFSSL